jgi:hypothetical protein
MHLRGRQLRSVDRWPNRHRFAASVADDSDAVGEDRDSADRRSLDSGERDSGEASEILKQRAMFPIDYWPAASVAPVAGSGASKPFAVGLSRMMDSSSADFEPAAEPEESEQPEVLSSELVLLPLLPLLAWQ